MKLTIIDEDKREIFATLFQLLKNWSGSVEMSFDDVRMYIQTMDKSHIGLADISISNVWFSSYSCDVPCKITVDSASFSLLVSNASKHGMLEISYDTTTNSDKLFISMLASSSQQPHEPIVEQKKSKAKTNNTKTYDHFFEMSLIDSENEPLQIPSMDYNIEFEMNSKQLSDLLLELNTFGTDMTINCFDECIEINSSNDNTKLKVNIPVDDLSQYSMTEDANGPLSFSLSHICKMCISSKLSKMVTVMISKDFPIMLKYQLSEELSYAAFYIAPKMEE